MKKLLILFIIFGLSLSSLKVYPQWSPVGFGGDYINCFVKSGNKIWGGGGTGSAKGHIFFSTNDGISWSLADSSGVFGGVKSIVISESNLLIGTDRRGTYLSTNNGYSWSPAGLSSHIVYSLAILGSNIFAGAGDAYFNKNYIFRTSNYGTNWDTIYNSNSNAINCLTISGSKIFAGTGNGDILYSTNNGNNWITINGFTVSSINTILIQGANIYIGTYGDGLWYSSDNGINWNYKGLINRNIRALSFYGSILFAGTLDGGFYLSTNNGTNWVNDGVFQINAMVLSNNYVIIAPYSGTLYKRHLQDFINIKNISLIIPNKFELYQNYPNPFNPITKIQFNVSKTSDIILKVFDLTGKEISTLINEKLNPGTYETQWNANEYSSGIYFYRLETGDYRETKRMILIK
jgi:hypothetical protein